MTTKRRLYLHYLCLAGAIILGASLRFWNLGLKPLWTDEVITAIFSLGNNYNNLPLNVLFPLERVPEIFTFNPGITYAQIANNLATQSTHPPLFFCGMYSWLEGINPSCQACVKELRLLPALFGVGAIAAIYAVNNIAFSSTAGIVGALLMAVSPFAVYLSQEARHYTIPMFLITLALLGLMQIQQDIFQKKTIRIWVLVLWVLVNIIGLYVHYFFVLAFIAEILTLLVLMYWGKTKVVNKRKIWLILILSTSTVMISFMPWLLVILSHSNFSQTNWLPPPSNIAPIYQTLISWVLMVIALPVENQPLAIAASYGFLMVIFTIWVGWQAYKGLKLLYYQSKTNLATLTLLIFTIFVLLQFFAIVYFVSKDITIVPRYHFVYYPSFCALVSASITKNQKAQLIIVLVGIISCIFVVYNLVFQKPFHPEQVAQNMNLEASIPVMLVVGYSDYQDIALGLSFALALEQLRNQSVSGEYKITHPIDTSRSDSFAILSKSPNLSALWNKLSQLPIPATSKLNLWIVGPGMIEQDYPQQLALSQQTTCTIDPSHHYRIGVPYQLYQCSN
ncbi:glycosyltransferase family 39 protein [Nostoc sp. 106C]|uniref:glycosyltransferase family 39 protein n=1 Tax=Nostoc sp. 106C TaxID=1932667 RepID=UPI000A3B37B1|nr:glycosyltransferase family 39 protein [Nostoc sp. 106C]OUL24872.1 hypothetical protein BV375_23525 [Nostoc sp. 106C]